MKSLIPILKKLYFLSTGYSYTNLGRLFMRLFVGLMLIQFGIRQIHSFEATAATFPMVLGMTSETALTTMILIEIIPGVFIMCGFLTRIMCFPPFIAMVIAEVYLLTDYVNQAPYLLSWQSPIYVPVFFMGCLFFMLLVGPGKISVDYFLSLHIIHTEDRNETIELEEV